MKVVTTDPAGSVVTGELSRKSGPVTLPSSVVPIANDKYGIPLQITISITVKVY